MGDSGTPGLEHRLGGLEEHRLETYATTPITMVMTAPPAGGLDKVANFIPPIEPFGEDEGDVLVIGWSNLARFAQLLRYCESGGRSAMCTCGINRFLDLGDVISLQGRCTRNEHGPVGYLAQVQISG